jgi:hypothetical protein
MSYLAISGSQERKDIEPQLSKTPSTPPSNDSEMSRQLVQPQVEHSLIASLSELCKHRIIRAAPNRGLTVKRPVNPIDVTCPRAFLSVTIGGKESSM